jgi:hypothetical protein
MLVLLAALPAAAASFSFKAAPDVDFAPYETYAWKPGKPARLTRVERQIADSVNRELAARGLKQAPDESAQLDVSTWVLIDRHELKDLDDPSYWEFWTGVTSVDAYTVQGGTLVVDVRDAETKLLLWRGVVSGPVRSGTEKSVKRLDGYVVKLFTRFPMR